MNPMEKRLAKTTSKINAIRAELIRHKRIPLIYEENLEEGLSITFSFPKRLKRRAGVRQNDRDYKLRSNQKRANLVYLRILDEIPQIYISFILAVSPQDCAPLDITLLVQQYSSQNLQPEAIQFDAGTERIIKEISTKHNCDRNPHYQKLLNILYPQVVTPKPISAAESGNKFLLEGLNPVAIHDHFGDRVHEAFNKGPGRLQEKATEKTRCAWIEFAQNGVDDSIFYLEIGNAEQFAYILFANAIRFLPKEHTDGQPGDNAYFSFKGASVSGIASLFSPEICAMIDASNLRAWEKEHCLLDTTDCVTMEMSRAKPHWGVIKVRTAVFAAYSVSHMLCE
ncbi:uncharacterized protein A1O5_03922 [Cladophialophora psammophila CBS 110553]|uniref:Uncharacterized protein n=1 Tax=Cladophialophora psammophila CBS 110553 TaxID=1182543 RepID=W9X606_9EURO|nr:uncharacterized protein A1O5_03922 [Cladophialophora psammophila CBS 110553]EXJ72775.1 hypothetical protein A1O5_03922 [Cladophialophora psammophila CBS 110553]